MESEITTAEPYQDFLFAMNSPVTRERYSTRLRSFFVFIGIEDSTMYERCTRFVAKVKENEENGNSKGRTLVLLNFFNIKKTDTIKKRFWGHRQRVLQSDKTIGICEYRCELIFDFVLCTH